MKKYLLTFMRVSAREINYILKYWLFKAYSLASFYEWYYRSFRGWYSEQRLSHLYHMQISLPPRFSSWQLARICRRCNGEYRYYVDNDRPENLGIMQQLALLGVTTSLHLAFGDINTECTVCLLSEISRCKRVRNSGNATLSRADLRDGSRDNRWLE